MSSTYLYRQAMDMLFILKTLAAKDSILWKFQRSIYHPTTAYTMLVSGLEIETPLRTEIRTNYKSCS